MPFRRTLTLSGGPVQNLNECIEMATLFAKDVRQILGDLGIKRQSLRLAKSLLICMSQVVRTPLMVQAPGGVEIASALCKIGGVFGRCGAAKVVFYVRQFRHVRDDTSIRPLRHS